MKIELYAFSGLDAIALYEILDLRNRVFVVEQNCVYLDTDYKDMKACHLLIRDDLHKLVAYSRLIPPGISYDDAASIGRVVTAPEARNTGLGKVLMKESITQTRLLYPECDVRIEAQSYLIPFYTSFGFEPYGDDYLLDGILHREMILQKEKL